MLVRVGRWLRAAGYDTHIIEGQEKDLEILRKALKEKRWLITRDRHFASEHEMEGMILLESNSVEECLQELSSKVSIDWTKAPFSRCLLCNQELVEATEDELKQAPEDVSRQSLPFWYCRHCEKLYWQGSHTDRMLEQLKKLKK